MTNLRLLMADEDERVRAEIKEAAYTCEEGTLQQRVEEILGRSKDRQRELFKLYWGHEEPTAENNVPVYQLHFPSPDYEPPSAA